MQQEPRLGRPLRALRLSPPGADGSGPDASLLAPEGSRGSPISSPQPGPRSRGLRAPRGVARPLLGALGGGAASGPRRTQHPRIPDPAGGTGSLLTAAEPAAVASLAEGAAGAAHRGHAAACPTPSGRRRSLDPRVPRPGRRSFPASAARLHRAQGAGAGGRGVGRGRQGGRAQVDPRVQVGEGGGRGRRSGSPIGTGDGSRRASAERAPLGHNHLNTRAGEGRLRPLAIDW